MIIYDPKLRQNAYDYTKGYTPDFDKKFDEADVARLGMLIARIAEEYDCSPSDSFSYEDADFAHLLRMVYEAGYNKACDRIKERIMPEIRGLIGYDY